MQHHHLPPRYDREGLAAWATERFHTIIDTDEIRLMLRPEIESLLIKQAHEHYQGANLSTSSIASSMRPTRAPRVARSSLRPTIPGPWKTSLPGRTRPWASM